MIWETWSELATRFGAWIVVLGVGTIMGAFMLYQRRGASRRKKSFEEREALPEEVWFELYYPDACNRALVRRVLVSLAEEIGINWSQLRPDDRFEDQIRIGERYAPYDDLDSTADALVEIMQACRVPQESWPPLRGDLRGFLDRLVRVCDQHSRRQECQV
jgi:hypothetical protein